MSRPVVKLEALPDYGGLLEGVGPAQMSIVALLLGPARQVWLRLTGREHDRL